MTERTDEELMAAYQKGDTRAFEILLRRHERGVFGFAMRMLGNRMQAEEATQESFLRLIQASSRYRADANLRNYLYRITRNLCLDILRRKSTKLEVGEDTMRAGGSVESAPSGHPGPERDADSRQTLEALQRAIGKLPEEQREVFLLKEVKDMKLRDVAAVTGSNLNTVKSRLRYALQNLREQLAGEGFGKETGHAV